MKARTVVTIKNKRGLHLSPASVFAEKASEFASKIMVFEENSEKEKWNGKRAIDLISIGAVDKTRLVIEAEGEDAEDAVKILKKLVKDNFGLKY